MTLSSFFDLLNDPKTGTALATLAGILIFAWLFLAAVWKMWLSDIWAQRPSMSWGKMLQTGAVGEIADWFIWRFTFFGATAVLVASAAAWIDGGTHQGLRILGLSLLLGAASTSSGWLLGLLFGVPRTLARGQAPNPGANKANDANTPAGQSPPGSGDRNPSSVNTNLEDISDWLTKTIVGVGLTQLYSVPHFLWAKAGQINDAGFGWKDHGQLLALAVFVYFATGGFWLGYVGTRTVLTRLLNMIDGASPASSSSFATDDNTQKLETFVLTPDKKSIDPAKSAAFAAAMKAANVPDMSIPSLLYGLAFAKERANIVKQLNL